MLEHLNIVTDAETGSLTAASPHVGLTVQRDGALFKRRAQRTNGSAECWLVGELDGVRTYVAVNHGQVNVVMTRDDLYPNP